MEENRTESIYSSSLSSPMTGSLHSLQYSIADRLLEGLAHIRHLVRCMRLKSGG